MGGFAAPIGSHPYGSTLGNAASSDFYPHARSPANPYANRNPFGHINAAAGPNANSYANGNAHRYVSSHLTL